MSKWRRVWIGIKGTKPRRYKRGWQKVKYPTDTHYSENFTKRELRCKCGCVPPKAVERELVILAKGLEELRARLGGKPLRIISGHRCKARNYVVNGALNSQHLYGTAADLGVPYGKQDEYVEAALKVAMFLDGGIGVYEHGGVHVDHRHYKARWNSWIGSRR